LDAAAAANSASIGLCAQYVRQALVAEGYTDLANGGPNADQYGPTLVNEQFTSIGQMAGGVWTTQNQTTYVPQAGDIAVFQPPTINDPSGGLGHIEMYDGTKWVSDYPQPNFLPGSVWSTSPYQIYRASST
jgi:hypothetical protein